MLKFGKLAPYSFEIAGKPYTLRALTLDSLDQFTELQKLDGAEQFEAMKALIRSNCDARTFTAIISNIPIATADGSPTLEDLILDWTGSRVPGVTPGESGA